MPHRLIALVFAASLFASVASAAPIGFATDSDLNLYSIDFGAGTATLIGPEGGGFMEALAVSPTGQLYGTSSSGRLYSIDTSSGAATLIGDTSLGNIEGLDFNGSTLLATNFASSTTFYSIDTSTAAATALTTTATGVMRTSAILDSNTALGLSDSPAFQTLVSVNLTTGAFVDIGSAFTREGVFGIDFASDGVLYGVGGDGSLFTVNTLTGAATKSADTGDQFWLGLAIAPAAVPEPVSLLLMGIGLGCAGVRRYRRSR